MHVFLISLLISSSGKVIQATVTPKRPVIWQTDKIWGLRSCHSSVNVWITVLPRKVHMHDWGCMGLILLHSPLCLWGICVGKEGLMIERKTGLQGRGMGLSITFWVVSSFAMWIFWLVIPFIAITFTQQKRKNPTLTDYIYSLVWTQFPHHPGIPWVIWTKTNTIQTNKNW